MRRRHKVSNICKNFSTRTGLGFGNIPYPPSYSSSYPFLMMLMSRVMKITLTIFLINYKAFVDKIMNKNTHSKQPYSSHFGGLFNISIIKLISNNARFSNRLTNLQTSPETQRYCSNNVVSPPFEHGDNFHEVCKFASEPIGTYGVMEIHLSVILPLQLSDRA